MSSSYKKFIEGPEIMGVELRLLKRDAPRLGGGKSKTGHRLSLYAKRRRARVITIPKYVPCGARVCVKISKHYIVASRLDVTRATRSPPATRKTPNPASHIDEGPVRGRSGVVTVSVSAGSPHTP